jgi:hypothetical protein
MRHGDIIDSLVAELAPVRRLRSADTRASVWAGLAILCVGLGCCGLGTRADLPHKLFDVAYLAESAALVAMAGFSARNVFHDSIPGAAPSPSLRAAPTIAGLLWVMLVGFRWWAGTGDSEPSWAAGLPCVARIAGLALVPAIAISAMLRRAAPATYRRTGLLALVAAAALGVVGTQLMCAKDDPAHVLLWHAGPLALAALVGFATARPLLLRAKHARRPPHSPRSRP